MEYFALGYYLAHALARLPNSQHYEAERNGGLGVAMDVRFGPGSRHYGGGIFGSWMTACSRNGRLVYTDVEGRKRLKGPLAMGGLYFR